MKKTGDGLYLTALYLAVLPEFVPMIPQVVSWGGALLMLLYIGLSKGRTDSAYLRWTCAYCAFFGVSLLWSINIRSSGWVLLQILPIIVVCFGTTRYLNSERRLTSLFKCFFVLSMIMLVYILLRVDISSLSEGERLGSSGGALNDDGDNAVWNGNSIGMLLCFAIFFGMILYLRKKINVKMIVFLPILFLTIYVILMTGSRKALVILLIPACVYFYQNSHRSFIKAFPIVAILGAAVYYVVMEIPAVYNVLGTRMETLGEMMESGTDAGGDVSRLFLIQYGLEWFTEHPILGVGINCFRVLSNNTVMFAGKNFYAHNNYVELLVDVGIVGTLIYYAGYAYLFNRLIKLKGKFAFWGISCFFILAFRDFAMVSYYSMFNHLLICILFYMASYSTRLGIEKNENSRHYPSR